MGQFNERMEHNRIRTTKIFEFENTRNNVKKYCDHGETSNTEKQVTTNMAGPLVRYVNVLHLRHYLLNKLLKYYQLLLGTLDISGHFHKTR